MKLNCQFGKVNVEFETDTVRDAFSQLSAFQEVFGETVCGKCGSENLRFVVRKVEENEYYELRCVDCNAKLAFGVNKKGGTLFPKRKDKDGNWYDDRGWVKWNPNTQKEE